MNNKHLLWHIYNALKRLETHLDETYDVDFEFDSFLIGELRGKYFSEKPGSGEISVEEAFEQSIRDWEQSLGKKSNE